MFYGDEEERLKTVEYATKVLKGEYSQREASALSGISRYKISKAINEILTKNKGENPFK